VWTILSQDRILRRRRGVRILDPPHATRRHARHPLHGFASCLAQQWGPVQGVSASRSMLKRSREKTSRFAAWWFMKDSSHCKEILSSSSRTSASHHEMLHGGTMWLPRDGMQPMQVPEIPVRPRVMHLEAIGFRPLTAWNKGGCLSVIVSSFPRIACAYLWYYYQTVNTLIRMTINERRTCYYMSTVHSSACFLYFVWSSSKQCCQTQRRHGTPAYKTRGGKVVLN
jgi:hypothetical protein